MSQRTTMRLASQGALSKISVLGVVVIAIYFLVETVCGGQWRMSPTWLTS